MKKKLITLAAMIGGGVIVVLIAQAEDYGPFIVGPEQRSAKDATAFGGEPEDVAQRKLAAEEEARAYLQAEYWSKKQAGEGQ